MRVILLALMLAATVLPAHADTIPLEKGLVLVYEGYDPGGASRPPGFIERLVTIKDKSDSQITIEVQFNDHVGDAKNANTVVLDRVQQTVDMAEAHRIIFLYLAEDPPLLPGALYVHASKVMLTELEAGSSKLVFGSGPPGDYGGLFGFGSRKYYRGDLLVAEPKTAIKALVNGVETDLEAIHAGGIFRVADLQLAQDFWVSRDLDNPLILRAQGPGGDYIQLVRADFAGAEPEKKQVSATVERQLASKDCRATLPGIYFGTGSATLLPASQSALQQVGEVLAQHKDWNITIEGHTDNVGTDADNVDLSNRRAAAVKDALVSGFGADGAHLQAKGFGESRPVESNDTPVGRAANRRVELARSCS